MHYADIIASLIKCGHPPSKVASDLHKSRSMISMVIRGHRSSYDIASYIGAVTNIPLKRLWPDGRYNKPPRRKAA